MTGRASDELTRATRVRRAARVLFREVQGEAVLVDPDTGAYFALNEVGTLVWQALAAPATAAELCGRVMDAFEVDEPAAWRDLAAFLEDLRRHGLIETVDP